MGVWRETSMHQYTCLICMYTHKTGVTYPSSNTQSGRNSLVHISYFPVQLQAFECSGGPDIVKALCSLWIYGHVCCSVCRGGWVNAGGSPGLSCCCTFPWDPHFDFSHTFFSGESLQDTCMCEGLKRESWIQESGPHALCFSPQSPSCSSLKAYWCWWRRGMYSVGAHVIWLERQASREYVKSHPVTLLLKGSTHYRQLQLSIITGEKSTLLIHPTSLGPFCCFLAFWMLTTFQLFEISLR